MTTSDKELRNPFTGGQPNEFTQVTNRELPPARNVREIPNDMGLQRRMRASAVEHMDQERSKAPVGYRLDAIDPKYRTFVTGANHMLPNTAKEKGVPAINEPHEADSGVTVQRRAEDLSGKEVRKGLNTLKQYGHDPKDPMESLRESHRQALDHAIAQHIATGVHESSSQMFYGGSPTTEIPNEAMQQAHENGVMAARDRFSQGVRHLAMHPEFQSATPHLTHRERMHAATNIMAQTTADTSPNTKWRDRPGAKYEWPNMEQAEESATAAIEDREPKFISGRIGNVHKAALRTDEAIRSRNYDVHQYGDPISAAKTVAFRGGLIDKDSPDAFRVHDVHDASINAPWLGTAKAHMHERLDENGERVGHKVAVYEDTPKAQRRGLTPVTKESGAQGGRVKQIPDWGLSRPEAMLAEGRSTVHALNDLASRQVLSERGLSRGVNYADNQHTAQGLVWGHQQLKRPDVFVSPSDQYPVRREWADEGVNVPVGGDIRHMQHEHLNQTNLGPTFVPNTRKKFTQNVWPEGN